MKALVIPLKDPSNAKTRLSRLLSPQDRSRLAWAMFEDVTQAASLTSQPDFVVLVSSYPPAIAHALSLGFEALVESSQQSESASVDWASAVLAERGVDTVMRLPADAPLVRPSDIDSLLAIEVGRRGALLVPSSDGTGTNAIIRTPPTLFPSRFGPDSLALHKAEGLRVGVECHIVANDRIAVDIDEPSDLRVLLTRAADTQTFRVACEIGVSELLAAGDLESEGARTSSR